MSVRRRLGRLAVFLGSASITLLATTVCVYLVFGNGEPGDSLAYALFYVGYPAGLAALAAAVPALTNRDTRRLGLIGTVLAGPALVVTASLAYSAWLLRDFEPSF